MENHILIFKIIDKIIRLFMYEIYPLVESAEKLTTIRIKINGDDKNSIPINDSNFLFKLINNIYLSFYGKKENKELKMDIVCNDDIRSVFLMPNDIAANISDNRYALETKNFECFFDNAYLCCESKNATLKLLYDAFITKYKAIFNGDNYIPLKETMFDYLDSYMKLLLTAYNYTEGNQKIGDNIICDLVNFGIDFENYQVSIYNPYLMDSILAIIDNVKYMLFGKEFFKMGPILREAYIRLMYNKMRRRLRRFTWQTNGKVKNIAWIICPDDNYNSIYARKLENIASYENIRPIRLVEKIETGFLKINLIKKEQAEVNKKNEAFNIAILGELTENKEEKENRYKQLQQLIDSLYEHINFKLPKSSSYYTTIKIKWYTTEEHNDYIFTPSIKDNDSDKIKVECNVSNDKYDDFHFFSRQNIDRLIDDNEIVFILDCPFLYNDVQFEPDTKTLIYDLRQNPSYEHHYVEDGLHKNLINRGKLGGLLTQTMGHIIDYKVINGVIKPVIRQEIFDYIKDYINDTSKKENENLWLKDVYVYISSKTSIDSTLYSKLDIVRTEQYNGKYMNVANFENITDRSKIAPDLFLSGGNTPSVFTLHQLIKNISAELYSDYIKLLNINITESELINVFRETYIFLDYKNSSNQVDVKYYIGREIPEEIITKLITPIIRLYIKRAFSIDKTYMLNHCFITALATSLLSAAINVENIIFRNIYYNSENKIKLGDIERITGDIEKQYIYSIETLKKGIYYKDKTLYNHVVTKCMNALLCNGSKYTLLNDIKLNNQPIKTIFTGIKDACEKMDYKNSILYLNAVEMGKE